MRRALLGLLVSLPITAHAATFLYLSSAGPDEPALAGRRLRLERATSVYPYPAAGAGMAIGFPDPTFGSTIYVYVVPPPGERFAPGGYDGAADCGYSSRPGICVERDFYGAPIGGHLEVREASYDGAGNLTRFAAEFSQHGGAVGSELTGAIRFNVGDETCGGALDGTPCDDRDACSSTSACLRGQCVADTVVACDGAPAGPCHDAPTCDPVTGTCAPPSFWNDGISCVSADQCMPYGSCASGVCNGNSSVFCIDGDPCTADDCDTRVGCAYPALAGVCGRDGLPTALVFANGTPSEPEARLPFVVTPGMGMFLNTADDGSVTVQTNDGPYSAWSFTLAPPPGTTFLPGVYENVAPFVTAARSAGQAALEISNPLAGRCDTSPIGRIVVHEVDAHFREGDRGRALAFAADFEQRCPSGTRMIAGAVRFRAGDPSCVAAADGTPCDDLNACTGRSTCQAGACRGSDPVVCPAAIACHGPSVCDPTTGACFDGPALPDGAACDDPATCTVGGACELGVCGGGTKCDDGNPCTLDRCEGAGTCAHDVLPGCWLVAARVRLTAQASGTLQGQSVSCGPVHCQRVGQGALLFPGDGTYRELGGSVTCPSGSTTRVPDEIGTVRPNRHGRLRLRIGNRAEIRAALRKCLGHPVSIANQEWVKISASGRELTGMAHTRLTIFDRLPIVQTTVARLDGRLGTPPPPATIAPGASLCQEPLRLQCVAR